MPGLVRTDHDGAAERADHAESGHEPEHGHGGEVGEPGAGLNLDGLGERVGRAGGIKTGDGDVAVDAGPDPEAADHEEHGGDDACDEGDVAGTGLQGTFSAKRQVVAAVGHDHDEREHAAEQAERIQQAEERARVDRTHRFVDVERNALQQVAEGDAADHRRDGGAEEQEPVPRRAPLRGGHLGAEVEGDGTEDEGHQQDEHRPVEAGERRSVHHRPSGEHGPAAGDEPDLVAVPVRSDGVDHHAALVVVLAEERQERADAHVVAVHDGEADEQHADEKPPDYFEDFIVDHVRASA